VATSHGLAQLVSARLANESVPVKLKALNLVNILAGRGSPVLLRHLMEVRESLLPSLGDRRLDSAWEPPCLCGEIVYLSRAYDTGRRSRRQRRRQRLAGYRLVVGLALQRA
jgi:hypothetical protein